jgi:virginiamycin B lyase
MSRATIAALAAAAGLAAAAPAARAVEIKGFKAPHAAAYTNDLTPGPGAMWLTAEPPFGSTSQIVRVTLNGSRRAFTLPRGTEASEIARGGDGAFWLVLYRDGVPSIGRFTPRGGLRSFTLPRTPWRISGLTRGADGAMWFVEVFTGDREIVRTRRIGRISRDGAVSEFYVGRARGGGAEDSMTRGPDGALWFTDNTVRELGRITTSGRITRISAKGLKPRGCGNCQPDSLIAGPGRALWFDLADGDRIVRMSLSGQRRVYRIPAWGSQPTYIRSIARGPDRAIWFTTGSSVGRLSPASGAVSFWPFPAVVGVGGGGPLTPGPRRTLWWGSSKGIGRISAF